MSLAQIPAEMTAERRWVLWKYVDRDGKPRKVPKQPSRANAKSTDPATWCSYEEACLARGSSDYFDGIGFVLGDGWAGVDFDDVVLADGQTKPWAEDLILGMNSYAEVSPSKDGVKVFCKGSFPDTGKNVKVDGSGVEVYCDGRYFTVTGNHYGGTPLTVNDAQDALGDLRYRFFDDGLAAIDDPAENMRRRLSQMEEAVSGQGGSGQTIHAACEIVRHGFGDEEGFELLKHYNRERCSPPWDDVATTGENSLWRKWEAAKAFVAKERGGELPTQPRAPRTPFNLDLIPDREFDREDKFEQSFLIDGLVVEREHLILGGPQKTAKTSILVDIAVSLATGARCLGHFAVPEPQPVIIVSGESGGATLQKTARRIREARGVGLSDNLHWGLRLPNLSLREHLDAMERDIVRLGAKLVAIDPAYLALLSADAADGAKNVMYMGTILNAFGQVGQRTGATLLLVHHFNKQIKQGQPPSLSNLSQSGFAEWARQWVLLNHNRPYVRGQMELRVNIGGSAGHGGNYLWQIDQGRQVEGGVGWTDWRVSVDDLDAGDFAKAQQEAEERLAETIEKLTAVMTPWTPYTFSSVREAAGLSTGGRDAERWDDLRDVLVCREDFQVVEGKKANGNDSGQRLIYLS